MPCGAGKKRKTKVVRISQYSLDSAFLGVCGFNPMSFRGPHLSQHRIPEPGEYERQCNHERAKDDKGDADFGSFVFGDKVGGQVFKNFL
jgi:hypothetical protein